MLKLVGVLVVLGTCALVKAQSDPLKQFVALEDRYNQALVQADWKAIEQLEADDLVFTTADGSVTHKSDDVDSLRSGITKFESIHESELNVQTFGDVGIVTGKLIQRGRYKAVDIGGIYRFTDVWAKRNGRWQLVAGQETRCATLKR